MTQDEKLKLDNENRSWIFKPTEEAERNDRLTSTAKSIVAQKPDVDYDDLQANKMKPWSGEIRVVVVEIKDTR